MKFMNCNTSVIPGFTISLTVSMLYLSLTVLIPVAIFLIDSTGMGLNKFIDTIVSERVIHAYVITFGTSLIAAIVNAIMGTILAWVLVRYRFPGRRIMAGLVDLPFALPTAVAGIALTSLYAESGWFGQFFYSLGIETAFSEIGIIIALVFVGIPFVTRTVEPVLHEFDEQYEEAALVMGANGWKRFTSIILPEIYPSILLGAGMAFARGVGEYGSVVFISGNLPFKTEIAPLLIMNQLEAYDYDAAVAIALVLLVFSFLSLAAINLYQRHVYQLRGA